MNTTHTNGPIEQKEKQKATRLPDELDLRDYFAGQALMGMMASRNPSSPRFMPEDDAAYVYAVADAMLKERLK
jgi:hypothetical protein